MSRIYSWITSSYFSVSSSFFLIDYKSSLSLLFSLANPLELLSLFFSCATASSSYFFRSAFSFKKFLVRISSVCFVSVASLSNLVAFSLAILRSLVSSPIYEPESPAALLVNLSSSSKFLIFSSFSLTSLVRAVFSTCNKFAASRLSFSYSIRLWSSV